MTIHQSKKGNDNDQKAHENNCILYNKICLKIEEILFKMRWNFSTNNTVSKWQKLISDLSEMVI